MNKILTIILLISLMYLAYLYYRRFTLVPKQFIHKKVKPIRAIINNSKQKQITRPVKNKELQINPVIIDTDNDYQLSNGDINKLNNIIDEYVESKKRPHVFIDVSINNENIGRIIIELFDNVVPYTVKNFIYMIQNHYKGSKFHRIIKNFIIQGGDYINGDGTGSKSIYGERFKDENFIIKHDAKYLISMANAGPNTNGCQFFITLNPAKSLDNKHVVFGRVVDETSKAVIDKLGETLTNNDAPIVPCVITDCGLLDE